MVFVAGLVLRERTAAVASSGVVGFVYDGDTVQMAGGGKVRLLGVDCMDSHNERRAAGQAAYYGMPIERVRYWSQKATEFTIQQLKGKRVVLHQGPQQKDDYGRVLAYLHMRTEEGERDFNLWMLQRGLATAYRAFAHPRRPEYLDAETEARSERRGLWSDVGREP